MSVARGRLWTCLAIGVILVSLAVTSAHAGLFGLWGSRKRAVKQPRQSLVIFPFDRGPDVKIPLADDYGEYIASDLRTMLANNQKYRPFLYKERLAPIERAKVDNVLKTPDCAPPFAEDKAKTLKLAQILATDFFLVGEIDDLQIDRANRVAQITLRAELYDGKTGKLVKAFLVTGRTPENVKTSEEDELRDLAKGAAVTKLVAEFTAPEPEEASSAAPDKSSETEKSVPAAPTTPGAQSSPSPTEHPGH